MCRGKDPRNAAESVETTGQHRRRPFRELTYGGLQGLQGHAVQAHGFIDHSAVKFEILEPIKTDDRPSRSADTGPKRFRIGSDVEIAKRVADDLNARHGEVIFSEGDFWFYDKIHWRRIEKHNLSRAVHNYDGGQYPIGKSTSNVRLNKAHRDSIIHEMGVILERPDFFAVAPTGINCDSGFIRFADDGIPSQEAHAPEHRCRHALKGSWISNRIFSDMKSDGSLLRRLIEGVFRGDPDIDEKMALVQEIAGAVALGYGNESRATQGCDPGGRDGRERQEPASRPVSRSAASGRGGLHPSREDGRWAINSLPNRQASQCCGRAIWLRGYCKRYL